MTTAPTHLNGVVVGTATNQTITISGGTLPYSNITVTNVVGGGDGVYDRQLHSGSVQRHDFHFRHASRDGCGHVYAHRVG